jgi:hypothetical protein
MGPNNLQFIICTSQLLIKQGNSRRYAMRCCAMRCDVKRCAALNTALPIYRNQAVSARQIRLIPLRPLMQYDATRCNVLNVAFPLWPDLFKSGFVLAEAVAAAEGCGAGEGQALPRV